METGKKSHMRCHARTSAASLRAQGNLLDSEHTAPPLEGFLYSFLCCLVLFAMCFHHTHRFSYPAFGQTPSFSHLEGLMRRQLSPCVLPPDADP